MRAAILRAPPGAGKASSHATTRADPCRDSPAPGVDNLSLTLITSRDQSEQKPETRTQIPFRFRGSHLKKKSEGVHLFIGRNELIRTKREMSSHRRNQTHRQIPREIEAGVPENRSQKKQSAPQKPTDPWVFGYGKPPWETAAETLWETEVWCLLCARMHFLHFSHTSLNGRKGEREARFLGPWGPYHSAQSEKPVNESSERMGQSSLPRSLGSRDCAER